MAGELGQKISLLCTNSGFWVILKGSGFYKIRFSFIVSIIKIKSERLIFIFLVCQDCRIPILHSYSAAGKDSYGEDQEPFWLTLAKDIVWYAFNLRSETKIFRRLRDKDER